MAEHPVRAVGMVVEMGAAGTAVEALAAMMVVVREEVANVGCKAGGLAASLEESACHRKRLHRSLDADADGATGACCSLPHLSVREIRSRGLSLPFGVGL